MDICGQKVFKNIYFQWNAPLQHFLQSKGMELNAAADVVQDCFVRLWNNCAKVSEEKAKSYLFTVANNLFIDEYRKSQTRLKLLRRPSKDATREDGQFALEQTEFKAKLEAAIASMTGASREVFIMSRFDEMSYKAIAESLSISVKAVEKRMGKALKHLAESEINLKRR